MVPLRIESPRASQSKDRRGSGAERVLGAEQDGEHEAVVEVVGEHPDGARAPGVEGLRERVRGEGEGLGGVQHALAGLGAHLVAAVERFGGGGDRDAGGGRHIGERDRAGGLAWWHRSSAPDPAGRRVDPRTTPAKTEKTETTTSLDGLPCPA